MGTRYTVSDLHRVHRLYDKNFKKLMKACAVDNDYLHHHYLTREKRLNLIGKDILRELHILSADIDEIDPSNS